MNADPTNANTGMNPTSDDNQAKFDIPDIVKEQHPDLVEMILKTKSMDDDERQYWFHILPIMKEDQISELRKILVTEKNKLAEIEKKYADKEKPPIEKDPNSKFSADSYEKKKEELKKQEDTQEKAEKDMEADILSEIENM